MVEEDELQHITQLQNVSGANESTEQDLRYECLAAHLCYYQTYKQSNNLQKKERKKKSKM